MVTVTRTGRGVGGKGRKTRENKIKKKTRKHGTALKVQGQSRRSEGTD